MDLQLEGKVAFVTGASKGIGRCVASYLAREGSDVVITARTAEPLETAAAKIAADMGRAVLPDRHAGLLRGQFARRPVLVVGNDGLKPSYWEMTAGVANAADMNFASSVADMDQ